MLEKTRSSPMLRYSASRKVFTGMMSSPLTSILLYQAILSSAYGYKLPFVDQYPLPDHDATLLGKYNSSPLVNKFQWEIKDRVDTESPTLIRLIRQVSDKTKGDSRPDVKYPLKGEKVSKSPLEKTSDVKNLLKDETVSKSQPEKYSDVKYPLKVETVSKSPPETSSDVKYSSKVETVSKSQPEKYSDAKYPLKVETVSKSPPETSSDIKYSSKVETISKPLLEISSNVMPKIILPSKVPDFKVRTMALRSEEETTTVSKLDYITTVQERLNEADTTHSEKSMTEEINTIKDLKFASTQSQPFTSSFTKSEDIFVFTKTKADKTITISQPHSTGDQHLSSTPASTSATLDKYTSLVVPSQMPSDTPSKPPVTSADPTTIHKTTQWISDSTDSSTTPAMVTHMSTEDKIHTQSLMKQCMLAILILAVVCTIFIITTIALAAKISSMKQKQKLRHPATYTEMRCISSLLPESDRQSKLKPKRLKTFSATLEESDGDNTTLNSFLPDH